MSQPPGGDFPPPPSGEFPSPQGPPPSFEKQGPPPQGPPPGYSQQAPPPGYAPQGLPPGYPQQGPPPGYPPQNYPPQGYAGQPQGPGPLGRVRNIGVCILLAIVTLGIYTYVWVWKTQAEIKAHADVGVGGPVGFLLYFVFAPITYFLLPGEVRQMLARSGRESRVRGVTGFWLLLPLLGPIVWFVKVQGQLNEYWRSLGATG